MICTAQPKSNKFHFIVADAVVTPPPTQVVCFRKAGRPTSFLSEGFKTVVTPARCRRVAEPRPAAGTARCRRVSEPRPTGSSKFCIGPRSLFSGSLYSFKTQSNDTSNSRLDAGLERFNQEVPHPRCCCPFAGDGTKQLQNGSLSTDWIFVLSSDPSSLPFFSSHRCSMSVVPVLQLLVYFIHLPNASGRQKNSDLIENVLFDLQLLRRNVPAV